MSRSEHKDLRASLRKMVDGEWPGLILDSPTQWVVDSIKEPIPFFRSLARILPPDAVLYMEGNDIAPYVAGFYERHAPASIVPVASGILSPIPDMFHVSFSQEVVDGLCEMAAERPFWELFAHINGYHAGSLLFTFHDAFRGQLRISGNIEEPVVRVYCQSLGVTYSREQTKPMDIEKLRRILNAFENPNTRIVNPPFWKRLWHFLKGK